MRLRSLTSAICLIAAASALPPISGAAELRPTAPGWQELVVAKEAGGMKVQSRIEAAAIGLNLGNGNIEVLRTDPAAIVAVDKLRIVLDHVALVDALRGKPAAAALGAYRDFVNADLQKRGWREVAAERQTFAAGGQGPTIFWAMQAEVGPADKRATLTLGLAAALAGDSIVAMSGVAENAEGAGTIKHNLVATLATLAVSPGTAMTGDTVSRLRQEAQRLVYRMSSSSGVILLNDELASAQDRQNKSDDIRKFVLSPSDMADAAAAVVGGSPNGPFMTFVNDGRSQHTFLIHAYDPATASFDYSDSTGSRSMLEAGNNLAGVEAVRKPGTTDRLWVVKKDQLQTVLSGMIVGDADLLAVGRKIHLGPLGSLGNTPADAKATDFFKWFHFEETGKSPGADGGTTISYAPSAAKYRPLVTVRLHLAQAGWIRGAELVLKRRFIEDPREETSARDIAKSFLASASAKVDWNKIHRLHDEIFYLGSAKMMVHDSAAKDITIPLIPSDGYQVFTGRRGHFVDVLSRSRLWMENVAADGEPALLVSIGAGG
jgi:hypothetical protein